MTPRRSHHLIGLVRGQFGDAPESEWLDFIADAGFDGWEEAAWELDLAECDTAAGVRAAAAERVALARDRSGMILSVATHLLGQALGDEPSAKTLAFVGGEAVEAYVARRRSGHEPPRTDPYHVPAEVARLIHAQARRGLLRSVRLAGALGGLQGRRVPVTAFVGSPAHCWNHWFEFPPRPHAIGGYPIPDVIVELNRSGYSGGLVIEWEDNDAEKRAGALAALAAVRAADLPPSSGRHDDALRTRQQDPAVAS